VPGTASTALSSLLSSTATEAIVLGTASKAIWLQVGEEVIVISAGEGARLPNSIRLPAELGREALDRIYEGTEVVVGNGRVMLGSVSVTVGRWWDPRPALLPVTSAELAMRLADLPSEIPELDTSGLRRALEARSEGGLLHSSRSLLGRGLGLTPEGDDVLTGAIAALRLLGDATGREDVVVFVGAVSEPLAHLAASRTTAFSAALLRMALRGQVVESAGRLLQALAGRGNIAASHMELTRLGHSSGPAIAAGIVLGARSLTR
jgi:hypothetical protein